MACKRARRNRWDRGRVVEGYGESLELSYSLSTMVCRLHGIAQQRSRMRK